MNAEAPRIWIFIFFLPLILYSQPEIHLPGELTIMINDRIFDPSGSWTDSLLSEAANIYIRYEIVHVEQISDKIRTKIRVPQVFSFQAIIRQMILYYGLLNDEATRSKEVLLVYPFFNELNDQPAAQCVYMGAGRYHIDLNYWNKIPTPNPPGPEDIFLYNRLLETAKNEFGDHDGISEDTLQKVAMENDMCKQDLMQLYQNVKLWQLAQ